MGAAPSKIFLDRYPFHHTYRSDEQLQQIVFHRKKNLVVAKVLSWFEDMLNPLHKADGFEESFFVRIHRPHLINKCFIHQYIKGVGGKVKLYNGEQAGVSKRKKKMVLKSWYMAT
jgi:DNA-binding LytR/AlgR family response regulator